MPTETEISYKLPSALIRERLMNDPAFSGLKPREPIVTAMTAEYYDTPTHALAKAKITLRRRMEDGEPYITAKAFVRDEGRVRVRGIWECPGSEVALAIGTLVDIGAPKQLLELSAVEGFVAHGRFEFTRTRVTRMLGSGTSVEVCFDEGMIRSSDKSAEFSEVLFHLLYGEPSVMEAFAEALETKYSLTRELSSKYERVLRMIRTRQ